MSASKRQILKGMVGLLAAPLLLETTQTRAETGSARAQPEPHHDMSGMPASWHGREQIAMLLYPGFTALDFAGPQYMFGSLMGATVHHVAKTAEPVTSDTKLSIVPTATFETCPKDLDIVFVPGGGTGTLNAMKDEATVAFVKDRGVRAKYVVSVCTGSLLLGRAGLLEGYKATSHWIARDLLPLFGAIAVDERVVEDRNRVTGAGVSAGLDLGLTLVRRLRDEDYAKATALLAEYAPRPPLEAGTPQKAGPQTTALLTTMFEPFTKGVRALALTK